LFKAVRVVSLYVLEMIICLENSTQIHVVYYLHWIGLGWIGLDWIGLDWIRLGWVGFYGSSIS
jgi:hypothetical protein